MSKIAKALMVDDQEKQLDEIVRLLEEDPSNAKAAVYVLSLLEENRKNWVVLLEMFREAVKRVYFDEKHVTRE